MDTEAPTTEVAGGPTPLDIVGVPDGTVNSDGEMVVYEYDETGEFVGWHKEAIDG